MELSVSRGLRLAAALLISIAVSGCDRPSAKVAELGPALVEEKGCIACHKLNGEGVSATFPNLGGQWETYLRKQLLKYRSGERVNVIMNDQAKALTDEEIRILAAYFAGL